MSEEKPEDIFERLDRQFKTEHPDLYEALNMAVNCAIDGIFGIAVSSPNVLYVHPDTMRDLCFDRLLGQADRKRALRQGKARRRRKLVR